MQTVRTRAVEPGIASSILALAAQRTRRDWQVGSRVFANWSHDEYWYPATILSLEGDQVFVRFDDGDKEWMARDHLMPIDLEVGDAVVCKYKSGLYYFPAHILQMEGGRISVQYNYDATTSPDDPAPRVDCSSHFLLPAGWGMQSITHQENLKVWTQP
jgi:DNA repair protein Crb2 Tudor domain